jgi:hypothetical protein
MSSTITALSPTTTAQLEQIVDRIEANPGRLIQPGEMQAASDTIDMKSMVAGLPAGLTESDLVGILKLAMLTECATDSYAAVFEEGARLHDARWLSRFNQRVWVPDEHTHAMPFKLMLMSLGHEEHELDAEIAQVQAASYEHCCGTSPVEMTTYGLIQEYLTDHWHGLIAHLMKPAAPFAAHMANRVKARETLHALWYREMTAVQVAAHPQLLGPVADTVLGFEMPGAVLVPQYQSKALVWMPHLSVDFSRVARDLVRHFSVTAGNLRRSGELLVDLAVRRGYSVGPIPPRLVQRAFDVFGGHGYRLLGEAIFERVGLPSPERRPSTAGFPTPIRLVERARSKFRTFVANRIDLRAVTGETSST